MIKHQIIESFISLSICSILSSFSSLFSVIYSDLSFPPVSQLICYCILRLLSFWLPIFSFRCCFSRFRLLRMDLLNQRQDAVNDDSIAVEEI